MSSSNRSDITVDHHDLFKALLESSPILMAMLDPQFNFIQVNRAYAEADEKEPSFFPGKNHFDLYPNDENRQVFRKVVDNGQPYQNQTKPFKNERNKERGVSWWDWSLVPVKDDSGRVTALILSLVDVTEQKRAFEQLQENESTLRALLNAPTETAILVDLNGTVLAANDLAALRLGKKTHELIGLDIWNYLPHNLAVSRKAKGDEAVRTGKPVRFQDERAGRVYDNNCFPVFDSEGKIKALAVYGRDITDRKRTEDALRESEEKYRMLFETMEQGVVYQNAIGEIVSANPAAERILGLTLDQMQGRKSIDPRWKAVHEDGSDYPGETHPSMVALKSGEVVSDVIMGIFNPETEEYHWILINAVPQFKTGEDTPSQVYTTFTDITERKRAEEDLRESEKKYRDLVETSQDLIWKCDAEGKFTYLNQAWERTVGYKTNEMLGRPFSDFQRPEVYERDVKEFERHLVGGSVKGHETTYISKSGTDVHLVFNAIPLFDSDKNIIGTQGTAYDITERKQAEEALRESEEKYRALIESNPYGFQVIDVDGKILYSNPAYQKMVGYTEEELLGKSILDLLDTDEARDQLRLYLPVLVRDQPEPTPYLQRCRTKDGRIIDQEIAWNYHRDKEGQVVGFSSVITDITERKRAEEALHESEKKFKRITERIYDVIVATNLEGDINYVSPSIIRVFGYQPAELIGRRITEFIPPSKIPNAVETLQLIATGMDAEGYLSEFFKKDGSIASIELNAVPIIEDDQIVGAQAIIRDITETKQLRELESRAQRLETAGRIAGQVAHDFNNLLAPLMAYPEFIRDELDPDHPALQYLDDIENAAQQIADINQQLLTLGRRGHYNQEVMNLNDVVSQAARQMESLPSTLVVVAQLDEDLMNIKGGRSQIFRAVSNLLVNAREAMQDIGQITVRTENFYVDKMWINYAQVPQGEYVKLTISDTGCGIPDEIKQKIFEPFFTTKTADKKRGSGLGISVVDAVIKDHEGYIDLTSNMGEGTSFFIYFPVTREQIDTPIHHEIVGGRESILIVDDDKVQRDVCTKLLNSLGYQTTVVGSGAEALKALGDQRYDLLILDMIMPPGIDGAETFRQTLLIHPDQKAIIVSGFAESDRVAAALKLGAGAFVKKPLTRRRLATAVRDELDRVAHPA